MLNGFNVLTHSRMACFQACRRRHYFQYILGVRRIPGEALRMGGAVHLALHLLKGGKTIEEAILAIRNNYRPLILQAEDAEAKERFELERMKCFRLVQGWQWRWQDADIGVVASELAFNMPIVNPETGRPTPSYTYSGRIDAIVRMRTSGRHLVEEHKTTGESLGLDGDYWKSLRLDAQISRYVLAAQGLGHPVQSVLYDVIRKPSISPLNSIPIRDANACKMVVDANGNRIFKPSGAPRESADAKRGWFVQTRRESVDEYGLRLAKDIIARPTFYFARVEIPRLQSDIDEMQVEMWELQRDIRRAELKGVHYKNAGACRAPYSCPYLEICSTGTDLAVDTPEGFERVTNIHPELENENVWTTETEAGAAARDTATPFHNAGASSNGATDCTCD